MKIPHPLDISTRYPVGTFVLATFFCVLIASFSIQVETVNNVDYFTLEDSDAAFYRSFKKQFGGDEFFVIALHAENIFVPEVLKLLQDLTKKLEQLQDVRKVTSLANVDDLIGGEDTFEVRRFLETIPDDTAALEAMRQRAVAKVLYRGNLISADGRTASVMVFVHDRPNDHDYRLRLLAEVEHMLDQYKRRSPYYLSH